MPYVEHRRSSIRTDRYFVTSAMRGSPWTSIHFTGVPSECLLVRKQLTGAHTSSLRMQWSSTWQAIVSGGLLPAE
jgi:hypothetical protein